MLTWAIAYAVARGASEHWLWGAMPLDFLIFFALLETVKTCAKYRYIVTETRNAVDKIQTASTKWTSGPVQ
jgi:hypothetical protein